MSRLPHQEKNQTFYTVVGIQCTFSPCVLFIFWQGFSTVAQVSGSVDAVVNIGLTYISADYYALGIFFGLISFLVFWNLCWRNCRIRAIAIQLAQKVEQTLTSLGQVFWVVPCLATIFR